VDLMLHPAPHEAGTDEADDRGEGNAGDDAARRERRPRQLTHPSSA
jgi:hypothetical protein